MYHAPGLRFQHFFGCVRHEVCPGVHAGEVRVPAPTPCLTKASQENEHTWDTYTMQKLYDPVRTPRCAFELGALANLNHISWGTLDAEPTLRPLGVSDKLE